DHLNRYFAEPIFLFLLESVPVAPYNNLTVPLWIHNLLMKAVFELNLLYVAKFLIFLKPSRSHREYHQYPDQFLPNIPEKLKYFFDHFDTLHAIIELLLISPDKLSNG